MTDVGAARGRDGGGAKERNGREGGLVTENTHKKVIQRRSKDMEGRGKCREGNESEGKGRWYEQEKHE